MPKCKLCSNYITPSKDDYCSSTKIGYVKAGKKGVKPIKRSDTLFYHKMCRSKDRLTKEQLLDNWENGYFSDKAEHEY